MSGRRRLRSHGSVPPLSQSSSSVEVAESEEKKETEEEEENKEVKVDLDDDHVCSRALANLTIEHDAAPAVGLGGGGAVTDRQRRSQAKVKRSRSEPACGTLRAALGEALCLSGWRVTGLLGLGTVGTVFAACRDPESEVCAAVKVQRGRLAGSVRSELELQQQAYPASPRVFGSCEFQFRQEWFSAIIMERVQASTLDDWLVKKRTSAQMQDVVVQIEGLFRTLELAGVTHGDLALFNIGFQLERGRASGLRLVLLDFDRASGKLYLPEYDYLRLVVELDETTRSHRVSMECGGGNEIERNEEEKDASRCAVPMHPANEAFLRAAFIDYKTKDRVLGRVASRRLPMKFLRSSSVANKRWSAMEREYCQRVNVLCTQK